VEISARNRRSDRGDVLDLRTALDYITLSSHALGVLLDGSSAMTVHDLATYLNVDEKTVYRLAKRGELPGFKVAGTWRFQRSDIERWIEERKARAPVDERPEHQNLTGSIRARANRS
jgi:excisionase family DNA binding protein